MIIIKVYSISKIEFKINCYFNHNLYFYYNLQIIIIIKKLHIFIRNFIIIVVTIVMINGVIFIINLQQGILTKLRLFKMHLNFINILELMYNKLVS